MPSSCFGANPNFRKVEPSEMKGNGVFISKDTLNKNWT